MIRAAAWARTDSLRPADLAGSRTPCSAPWARAGRARQPRLPNPLEESSAIAEIPRGAGHRRVVLTFTWRAAGK